MHVLFPEFVLLISSVDVHGRARSADSGISRRLLKGQTTCHTGSAGTKCWMSKETLAEGGDIPYKLNNDVQVSFSSTQT